jgi:hypothetical protein
VLALWRLQDKLKALIDRAAFMPSFLTGASIEVCKPCTGLDMHKQLPAHAHACHITCSRQAGRLYLPYNLEMEKASSLKKGGATSCACIRCSPAEQLQAVQSKGGALLRTDTTAHIECGIAYWDGSRWPETCQPEITEHCKGLHNIMRRHQQLYSRLPCEVAGP